MIRGIESQLLTDRLGAFLEIFGDRQATGMIATSESVNWGLTDDADEHNRDRDGDAAAPAFDNTGAYRCLAARPAPATPVPSPRTVCLCRAPRAARPNPRGLCARRPRRPGDGRPGAGRRADGHDLHQQHRADIERNPNLGSSHRVHHGHRHLHAVQRRDIYW